MIFGVRKVYNKLKNMIFDFKPQKMIELSRHDFIVFTWHLLCILTFSHFNLLLQNLFNQLESMAKDGSCEEEIQI
jgi:hypothetical protein